MSIPWLVVQQQLRQQQQQHDARLAENKFIFVGQWISNCPLENCRSNFPGLQHTFTELFDANSPATIIVQQLEKLPGCPRTSSPKTKHNVPKTNKKHSISSRISCQGSPNLHFLRFPVVQKQPNCAVLIDHLSVDKIHLWLKVFKIQCAVITSHKPVTEVLQLILSGLRRFK